MSTADLDTIHAAPLPSTALWDHEASAGPPVADAPATDTSSCAGAPRSGRLVGIDVARALALMGMFTQHVSIGSDDGDASTGWVAWVFRESAGRASVLFFVLSGVSLSIIATKGSASASDSALRRRGFLLLTGGLLLTISLWPASILQHYGLAFLLAPWLLRLGRRGLLVVSGVGLIGGPIFLLFARNWADEVNGIWSGRSGAWVIEAAWDILVSGSYPMVLWIGFFTFGMALGRTDLRSRRRLGRMLGAAVVATVVFGGIAAGLTDRFGDYGDGAMFDGSGSDLGSGSGSVVDPWEDDSLWKELPDGSFEFLGDESKLDAFEDGAGDFRSIDRPADWRELYDVSGHSGHIGWTLQTSAIAVAIMSVALLLPSAATRMLHPLSVMGAMSLTAYLVHIVLVTDVFDRFVLESGWPVVAQEWAVLGLIGAMVLACGVFHRLWGVGPFERLLKKFTVTP